MLCHDVPLLYQKDLVSVSYTIKPIVCGMSNLDAVLILGMRNPLVVDLISTIALGSAFDPSVLMARFCALERKGAHAIASISMYNCFIEKFFKCETGSWILYGSL